MAMDQIAVGSTHYSSTVDDVLQSSSFRHFRKGDAEDVCDQQPGELWRIPRIPRSTQWKLILYEDNFKYS